MDDFREKKDEKDVISAMATIESMINPFESERTELLQLASGTVADAQTTLDMRNLWKLGQEKTQDFINNRIMCEESNIYSTIKRSKLHTFTNMHKNLQTKTSKGEIVAIKNTKNVFAKLIPLAHSRDVDMREALQYPLRPHPLPFATVDGKLVKTMKSKLLQLLEGAVDDPLVTCVIGQIALMIDAMALLQTVQPEFQTFGQLSYKILDQIITLSKSFNCVRVDFIADRYPNPSIKDLERAKRASGGSQIIRIFNGPQHVPRQWKKFMSNGENKEELMKFLFIHWQSADPGIFGNLKVYLTHESKCQSFIQYDNELAITEVSQLVCDHEEVDTRLISHAYQASSSYENIIIRSPDTDVFIISMHATGQMNSHIYFATGTQNKKRIIDVNKVVEHWGRALADALIGIHTFTGYFFLFFFITLSFFKSIMARIILRLKKICFKVKH